MKKLFKILLFFSAFCLFTFAIVQPLNMVGNWYQQFLPSGLPNFQISDVYFLDSLTGFVVTGNGSPNDSSGYILKTTNRGDNWTLKFAEYRDFSMVKFINQNTGFVSGGYFNGARLYKTTNGGENWFNIYNLAQIYLNDMYVLNNDTIWVVNSNGLEGGVFRTTDSGASWQQQYYQFNQNPDRIYMYDRNIGFFSKTNMSSLYRTTNSGINWTQITGETGFSDIHFVDSQTGWKAAGTIKKTTNGGLNWVQQTLPSGGIIISSGAGKLSVLNKDTIWAAGLYVQYPNLQSRGIILRTINGGQNWLFQIPDTAIHSNTYYSHIQFINAKTGWAHTLSIGIHTTNGGDTTWIVGVKQISSEVPKDFKLFQNYPNPFNPKTIIRFQINRLSDLKLVVYDIQGKQISELANGKYSAGTYEVDFSGNGYSSGIYFYKLTINELLFGVKKMILIK